MRTTGIVPAVVVLLVAVGMSVSEHLADAAPISSTFDSSADGWQVADLNVPYFPPTVHQTLPMTWESSGGNPDGCVHAHDESYPSNYSFWFKAPAKFLGNQASAYGGALSFDLKSSPSDGSPYSGVMLAGSGKTLVWPAMSAPSPTWNSYGLPLNSGSDWRVGSPTGSVANAQDFQDVLSALDTIYIRGDWYVGNETTTLDNVVLTPEPATLSLLAFGLLAALRGRRKWLTPTAVLAVLVSACSVAHAQCDPGPPGLGTYGITVECELSSSPTLHLEYYSPCGLYFPGYSDIGLSGNHTYSLTLTENAITLAMSVECGVSGEGHNFVWLYPSITTAATGPGYLYSWVTCTARARAGGPPGEGSVQWVYADINYGGSPSPLIHDTNYDLISQGWSNQWVSWPMFVNGYIPGDPEMPGSPPVDPGVTGICLQPVIAAEAWSYPGDYAFVSVDLRAGVVFSPIELADPPSQVPVTSTLVTWIEPAGGAFATSTNWRDSAGRNRVPDMLDDVVLGLANTYSMSLSGNQTVKSLSVSAGQATLALGNNTLNVREAVSVAGQGTLTLSGTGELRAGSLTVGGVGSGIFIQSGGTNIINGSLSVATTPGATGSYTIGGGRLEVQDLDIGSAGEGTFAISDSSADITVSGTLRFGPGASFSAVPGSTIHVKGLSVQNESTIPDALSGLDYTRLVFEGGNAVTTSLEAASAPDKRFLGNCALGDLDVGGSATGHVRLADAFDNGKRKDGKECIYAYNFDIAPTSSVDTRGLTLYEYGNDAEPLKAAIADGRLRDTTVTGKDRLDAVYDRDNNWTLVAQRVIRDMAGVPEYKWRRGCSPTSAAMIMGYWDQSHPNMWPGTPPSSNDAHNDADPVNQVIEHLGVLMWTSSEGATRPLRIPGAMTEFAKEKGYSFIAGIKCVSDSQCSGMEGLSFAYLKKEIDAGRPMEIKLDTPAGFHSVVAYGYQDFPGTYDDYFAVRDTWWTGDPNHNGVVFKLEDGIEWWKWATDTTQPYYLYMGTFFSPANSAHEHYGLLESSFQSAGDFQEAFSVRAGASGGASLVTLANEPQESVLRMEAAGSTGPDDCIVSSPVSTPEQFKVSFLYAFETLGTLEVLLDGLLLAELADATGLGQVDDSGDFRSFSQEFSLLDYGLDPTLCHEFSLKLLAGSDHVLYVDNLLVCDPLATPLPEPTTLALLALGGLLVLRRRSRQASRRC